MDLVTRAELFRALGEPTRLAIVHLLRGGSHPVHEIADRFPVSRPAISRHLSVLVRAGLVSEERRGRERWYTLRPTGLAAVARAVPTRPSSPTRPPAGEDGWRCW